MSLLQEIKSIQEEQKNKTLEKIQEEFYQQEFLPLLKREVRKNPNADSTFILEKKYEGIKSPLSIEKNFLYIKSRLAEENITITVRKSEVYNCIAYDIHWK